VPTSTTRELLVIDLRTYGEDAVAAAVMQANEQTLEQIFERADHCLYADELAKPSGASPFLAEALSRGRRGDRRKVASASLETPKVEGIYPGR
jgi:predicted signal transduction protein with EAL and GGDEF domain